MITNKCRHSETVGHESERVGPCECYETDESSQYAQKRHPHESAKDWTLSDTLIQTSD